MENTNQKTYLVSFGNSRQYLYRQSGNEATGSNGITEIEKQLTDSLAKKFPQAPISYYTTAKISEINTADMKNYLGYPELDPRAVKEIEETLATGIEDENALLSLDRDAPWSNV